MHIFYDFLNIFMRHGGRSIMPGVQWMGLRHKHLGILTLPDAALQCADPESSEQILHPSVLMLPMSVCACVLFVVVAKSVTECMDLREIQ